MAAMVSIIFGFIELVVGARFFLHLFGANPTTPFVAWVYDMSAPLVAPFMGIFGQQSVSPGAVVHAVFEPSTLVALIIYAAIGGILLQLFRSHSH